MSYNINPKYVREVWIIHCEPPMGFYLTDPTGAVVQTPGVNMCTPRQLAKIAWDKGAQEIKYDFDLNLDPDKQ